MHTITGQRYAVFHYATALCARQARNTTQTLEALLAVKPSETLFVWAQVKPHHRRASALLQLGLFPEAEAACELGLLSSPGNANLEDLLAQIEAAKPLAHPAEQKREKGPAPRRAGQGANTTRGVSERELREMHDKGTASVQEVRMKLP